MDRIRCPSRRSTGSHATDVTDERERRATDPEAQLVGAGI